MNSNEKSFCDLLDDYFKALVGGLSQNAIDKARIALVEEYEFRAGKKAATRGVVGKFAELPAMPCNEITQGQIATLMQPVFQQMPFVDGRWHMLTVSIKRDRHGLGLRSIKWESEP